MAYKNKEDARRWYQAHKIEERRKALQRNKANRLANRQYVQELKANKPCRDCGQCYPHYVMDFDHRNPAEKCGHINKLLSHSRSKLDFEIAKCDLLCANCHRERTHGTEDRSLVR